MKLNFRKLWRLLIVLIMTLSVLIIAYKVIEITHQVRLKRSIGKYAGDGKIKYLPAPPVPGCIFCDGVEVMLPKLTGNITTTEYSLEGLPAGRSYWILFQIPMETRYIKQFPGRLEIAVYANGNLIQSETSAKVRLIDAFTTYNEFYFDSLAGAKIPQEKTNDTKLRIKIQYHGAVSIQPILRSGGEL